MARRAHNPRGDEHLRALERGMVAGELTPAWHAAWERAGRPGRDPRLEPRAGDVFLTRRTHDPRFDEAYGDPRETIVVLEGHEATGAPPPHALAPAHFWRREASATQTRHAKQIHGDAQWLVRVSTSGGEHGPAPRERWFHVTSLIHVLQGATVLRREPDTTMRTNPGDDRLRDLERHARLGDPAAAAAWRVEALRRGVDAWPDRDPLRDPIPGDVVDMTYHGGGEHRRYEVLAVDGDRVRRRVLSVIDGVTGQPRTYEYMPKTKNGALRAYAGMPGWVDWIQQGTWCSQCAPGRRTGEGGRVVFRAPSMHPAPAGWKLARRRRVRRTVRCTCGRLGPDSGEFDPYCPLHGTLPPRLNPPRGDDELRRLERRAAQGDPVAEAAYHRALERRGVARDRGLMLPRLEVVRGIWTPRAEVLCWPCHGPNDPRFAMTPAQRAQAMTPYPESEVREWNAVTTCDRCNRRVALDSKVAHEHELVKRLQHVLAGTDAEARMEQTGGMCSGLSVTWPQNARGGFAFVVEDEEHDGLFHMTTHPFAAEFWNGDATPLQVVSGDAATVVSAIVDAVRS